MPPSSDLVSLRNFVVDEDRANLGSDLWKSVDKNAYILAQRDAIEAYNLAKAIRLSEESAAKEERMRLAQAEDAARAPAQSWNANGPQSALLKNTPRPSSSSRPVLKRDPPSSSSSSSKVSSASVAAAAAESSTSHQKRRKASVSASQPHYSYSNYAYNHSSTHHPLTSASSQASVHAQQQLEARKHSASSAASSRDIQAGYILNPKESSPRTQSPSSTASAQAAAAEREKEKEKEKVKEKEKETSRSNSNSGSSSSAAPQGPPPPQVQVPSQTQSQPQSQPQSQQRQQGLKDIFAPLRFNCTKCGNLISSIALTQPSSALTSPDPFAHPFASALHVICSNPSCGAAHCRGCSQVIKCRDVDHPSSSSVDSQALVPVSSSTSTSPPASNPTSPTRPTFTASKSHQTQAQNQRACAGGPGCALWSCCATVRVIAIWEAVRAFDELFRAEAGFKVSIQGQESGRHHRETYVRMAISKTDKSTRRFEDGFVRVLKVVGSWLHVPAESSAQFNRDGGSSRRQSTILDLEQDSSQSSDDDIHLLHLARLFLSSHLLEVVHTFLGNRNVKDWMTHAETYLDVLEVVRKLTDCGLGFLLKEISGSGTSSSPSGSYNSFASSASASPPSLSASSSPSRSPPVIPLTLTSSSMPTGPQVTLYELITQLESYRGELKRFLTKVSFGVTVDKANKLQEAITYLVLQLVVEEF